MQIRGVTVESTYAEAFAMWGTRVVITAHSHRWAQTAAEKLTGFATSVIGCGVEAGIESEVGGDETPDGRPGVAVLLFTPTKDALEKQLLNRIGQTVMTCPTTACFAGLAPGEEQIPVGGRLRFFGDGHQSSKLLGGERYWRIPVMDGEFLIQEGFPVQKGVGGGNFLILAETLEAALESAEAAAAAIEGLPGVIAPFPGGVVRSGSKVGSRYKALSASTNEAYCPTLRSRVETALPEGVNAVYELVLDGLDEASVRQAMRQGILAACRPGVRQISAGNYGGKLGQYQFHLEEVLAGA